ncbi:MAG TPA: ribonuclease PH [Candidatus Akkermansia intestinigallinarum]|uniref:Ribonuclease PH n=1 Tax=Candidatus Akkermansia intestinigallinarum TaxID=2838431 RepID=A0A9D2AGD4_9BACT|nr:ribonuclease PH [Candidatus Akkermansia intestinigallinarum]
MNRPNQRALDEMRPLEFILNVAPNATASVLSCFGNTRVICAVSVENDVPRWMKNQHVPGGWLTAEYSMLPYSTLDRKKRDSLGKQDGRSVEIQRLIGRSLRAVTDLEALGERTVCIDCDVLQADGGTRTASITGAAVALVIAMNRLVARGEIERNPVRQLVSAVSVGKLSGTPLLDLCYVEDRDAEVDMNIVMTEKGEYVEVQGSGEEAVFTADEMAQMLALASKGIARITEVQKEAIARADAVSASDVSSLRDFFASR